MIELTAEEVLADKAYTVKDLASMFEVSNDTILMWIRKDIFPHAYKRGPWRRSRWQVPARDVAAYRERITGLPSRLYSDEEE